MRDAEAAEAVKSLLLDLEPLQKWMQIATKEIRLMNSCSFLAPKDESFFSVCNESPQESGHGGVQVNIASSILGFWRLLAPLPDGLLHRQGVAHKMLHFETEKFTRTKARCREQAECNPA